MQSDDLEKYLSDTVLAGAEQFRRKKETAILVIMFIDMVHSTAMREKMGEIQFENLRRTKKKELMAIIEQARHGKVLKDIGDGLLGVFAIPDIAVRNALKIQESLAAHPSFKVRIGLDLGQVTQELEEGIVRDVFGRHVNRAARLESLGAGGHVLISYTVWDSAKGWLKHFDHIRWKKHGSYRLKGLAEPQIVYEPYDIKITKPLRKLNGERVAPDEELTYCNLCGRYVKLKDTFTCRTCGTSGICVQYCYDSEQRQCIECAAKAVTGEIEVVSETGGADISVHSPSPNPSLQGRGISLETPEFDIFLSYAPYDQGFVMHLADYFRQEGLKVWIDEEQIDIGDQVTEKIDRGLRKSRFIVVCLSKQFNDSMWCRSEYNRLLIRETQAQNSKVLPVIVGDYEEVDIPDFLYDKYYVDIRTNQGLERLLRKLSAEAGKGKTQPGISGTQTVIPEELQAGLTELQNQLLLFSKASRINDEMVFEFDKVGIKLLSLLEGFSAHFDVFYEVVAEYQELAEKMFNTVADQEYRRVLGFRFKKVEDCIEDLAGGFNCGESFLGEELHPLASGSPYSFYSVDLDEAELEDRVKKLLSGNELEESEGLDWLLKSGMAEVETRLRKIAGSNLLDNVLKVLWKRSPRIFLYYNTIFWELVKYMLVHNKIKWKLRLYALKLLLKRSLAAQHAAEILNNFVPEEQQILSAFLMLHPKHECRKLAIEYLPGADRWDLMLCPKVPLLIVKELVYKSCQDSSDNYIKALFLLLRPRLLTVNSPLAIGEAYTIIQMFYHKPLFLQETFFNALIELHKTLSKRTEAHPVTQKLEQQLKQTFQAFCSKGKLRDVDIKEMQHIPLPIQRKLAHDGYLPKFFICNIRDLIAMETVQHVEKRPDLIKFFRLRPINGRALEKLAGNELVMKEYRNRATFCRNPKANPVLLRRYLSTLTRFDLKEISHDRNVSNFAREMAAKFLSRYH